ncbi:hypothetical protein Bbelb_047340 [Branchiostoma belcheri]|nr:hypothetical protein Bbelb_047340 [Branchiostoma belcheri]
MKPGRSGRGEMFLLPDAWPLVKDYSHLCYNHLSFLFLREDVWVHATAKPQRSAGRPSCPDGRLNSKQTRAPRLPTAPYPTSVLGSLPAESKMKKGEETDPKRRNLTAFSMVLWRLTPKV